MMNACFLVTKIALLSFFALNGWNVLQDVGKHTTKFKNSYKTLEKTVKSRLGVDLPPAVNSSNVGKNSEYIVKGLAWAQIALAVGAVLLTGKLAALLGIVYFVQELVHLNVANVSLKTPLGEVEHFALAVALLTACMLLAGYSTCCTKCAVGARGDRDSRLSDVESRSRDKKRN